ncbi:LuxR C-terminal-related transcriptional regulator [Silvimonas sp.]|uniref:LuxR C-terminal-related transcriptional regulator n=1 Tax=Silvimonas sp. TaxID=2650811 RepID=UPI00284A1983|nr:LuxR C-terminal-related transcriptional regulator [Silvimonas sp.]MDR3429411.1 LuxR C-terminal-related transcriptional regulator [Silvimonas sp.]
MSSESSGAFGAVTEFVLKTTPPKAPRHLLVRPRLSAIEDSFREHRLIVVQAPAGFGKTSLLAQWRREYLTQGAVVAWLLADGRDDPYRFLQGLVHAVRVGAARPNFGRLLVEGATAVVGELEGVTTWLAELAMSALDLVLFIDEADHLPEASLTALTYLMHNAPSNLRVVVAARSGITAAVADLEGYGQCAVIGAETLRFRLDETIALIRNRFGARVDADTCARLHELAEGWSLGLQLTLSAMERESDPLSVLGSLSSSAGGLRDYFVDGLLSKLPAADLTFLTSIALVDQLHPDLCAALSSHEHAEEQLARLMRETPIFVASENGTWCRLHMLARDVLRARFAQLPQKEQAQLHGRAMHWLAEHGMVEEAARHAYAAGEYSVAFAFAERCFYDAVRQGHQVAVLDWFERLSESDLEQRPRLRLAAAWVLARSERHDEAERQVDRLLANPDIDDELRYECALIMCAAAYFGDDPDLFVAMFKPWAGSAPTRDPWLLQIHANRLAGNAILHGDPAQARRHQQLVPAFGGDRPAGYVARWGGLMVGLSYLVEGQFRLAEEVLRPALAGAELGLGRRNPLSCMLASLLATAVYERDQLDEAAALLANRLDVLERTGTPETVMYAYRAAARVAAAQGSEHRALDLLEAMYSTGVARNLPRLCVVSLAEQIRIHAGRFRSETCRALVQRIDEIVQANADRGPLWQKLVIFFQTLSHAYAAFSVQNWRGALEDLAIAGPQADAMKIGRYRIEIMALRAFALDNVGEDGVPLIREAMNLAQTFGLARTLADAHPSLADWARRVAKESEDVGAGGQIPRAARPPVENKNAAPRALPSMGLTPRERDLLEQLARNLSNKEIAIAMSVSEETVKWHLKNLFGKLDAGSRRQVVRRAQLLGFLEGGGAT